MIMVLVCLTGQQTNQTWYYQEENEKHADETNADELKATVEETWASIPPQQCHKLITSMPRRIEAVIKEKRAPTKY